MSDSAAPRISVCIVCRNEADKLRPCLDSVRWADEVIVMDLESSDGSAEVAVEHGARVLRREPLPIVEPLRGELAAEATGEWILAVDPDERVSPGLADALRRVSLRDDVDAVAIPFTHYDFGYAPAHELHRYDPHPRMYRRGVVEWPTEPNRNPAVAEGRTLQLPFDDDSVMIHDRNRSVVEALDRVVRYAPAEAQAMIDRGEVFSARRMFATLRGKARKQFLQGQPWRDGVPGIVRASVLFAFHFYVWACFWERSGRPKTAEDDAYVLRVTRPLRAAVSARRALRAPAGIARRRAGRGG
jgi:glycosyltransferase involved in cell wall biosynthesis